MKATYRKTRVFVVYLSAAIHSATREDEASDEKEVGVDYENQSKVQLLRSSQIYAINIIGARPPGPIAAQDSPV